MISHRFTDILHVCDRIVVVRQGQIAGELAPHAQPPERTMAAMHALMTGDTLGAGVTARAGGLEARPAAFASGQDTSLGLLAIARPAGRDPLLRLALFPHRDQSAEIGRGIAIVGIVAVGETIVIIAGGFDLSVGSTMAAAGMTAGWMVTQGVPLPFAFAVAIAHRARRRLRQRDHHQLRPDQSADRDAGDPGDRARAELRHLRRPRDGDFGSRLPAASASASCSAFPLSS